ncbi:MAG: DUF4129 domain-containing protein [Chloroflexi bacterium]|nr:DUF4129 domain-containing protein [Chloroflexota bacterium]
MSWLWRVLDWRREALHLLAAAMEACWLYLWMGFAISFLSGSEYALAPGLVFLWLFGAATLLRLLNNLTMPLLRQQAILMGLGLLAILAGLRWELYGGGELLSAEWIGRLFREVAAYELAIPPQLTLFLAGLFIWWRGLRLGQEALGAMVVGKRFRAGIVLLMLYLVVSAFGAAKLPALLLPAYFFFGLVAIALARIIDLGESRGGVRAPFTGSWLGILSGSALLAVLLGLLAASLLSLERLQAALDRLLGLLEPLRTVLFAIIGLFFYVAVTIGSWLGQLLRRLFGEPEPGEEVLPDLSILEDLGEQLEGLETGSWVKVGRDALLVAVVIAAILLVFFAAQRRYRRRQRQRDVLRESVWSSDDFLDDLAGMLRGGWQRLRDGAAQGLAILRGERYPLDSIRRIYASLNRLGQERGHPRRDAETPYEYRHELDAAWPEHAEEVRQLTEAYVQAHYGGRADSAEALAQARAAWERLRAAKPPEPS